MSLLNKATTRKFILDYAKRTRPRFTRVSSEAYEKLEFKLRASIRDMIDRHPSTGKTVKP